MPYLWKQLLYPSTTPGTGDFYTNPYVGVNADGEIILLGTQITNYDSGTGPYPMTGFFVGYDYFGIQNTTQTTVTSDTWDATTVSNLVGSSYHHALALPGTDGGDAFYVGDDGAGHFTINRDVIKVTGDNSFSQTTNVVDNTISDSTDTIVDFSAPYRYVTSSNNPGTYGIAYTVLDGSGNLNVHWQGYNADDSVANVSPIDLLGGSIAISGDTTPADFVASAANAFVVAYEEDNSGQHYIHFQSFDPDGTFNTNIGGGTGHFNLNFGGTVTTDITQIRFHQFNGSGPAVNPTAFAVVDSEFHSDDSLYHVIYRTNVTGSFAGMSLDTASSPQTVRVSLNQTDGTAWVGWGDPSGTGVTIAAINPDGTLMTFDNMSTTYSIDDGRFTQLNVLDDGRVAVDFRNDLAFSNSQDVIDIVDFRTPGQTIDIHTTSTGERHNIAGTSGNDFITGSDADPNIIYGAGGSDDFIFDSAMYTRVQSGPYDEVVDYNQGNTGHYSGAEGDQIDVSAIVGAALTGGQAVTSLVHVFDDGDRGTFLMVDSDGTDNGTHYVRLAQLDGIHASYTVNAIVDAATPGGTTLGVESNQGYAGNFNSGTDGISDLLLVNDNGFARMYEMNGADSGPQVLADLAVGQIPAGWHVAALGDFNNDGNSDIVLVNDSLHQIRIWEMTGNAVSANLPAGPLPSGWHIDGVGDFNNDNIDDLLLRNDNGTVRIYEMNGNASGSQLAANVLVGSVANNWHIAGVGDFNNDGISDALIRDDATGFMRLWEFNGAASGSNQIGADLPIGNLSTDWHVEGIGDFNSDGISDILLRNDDGHVRLWEMNGAASGNQILHNVNVGNLPTNWHFAGTGDFNNDGISDVLLRDDSEHVRIWELNNAAPGLGQLLHNQAVTTLSADWATTAHHYDLV